ncbi:ABC transporter substrate-binding protein [Bacillus suaedaesalsae]|uniref:SgrR family transcriptional regulator n=1 Tax=Bacillus suaedaesalsae TaxID=2810349 RepID=A0ABS2DHQ5_9BACI|nr:ABC transporter substrate-binding protein [Bacillus suaedaesalsae]MBM6618022.1 SgrR family transcriptional regulator [Bacillus suaedaesalsae]
MNIEQYYISLRKQYRSKGEGETFPILMDELLQTLKCTRRNAQLLLKKMTDVEYVNWMPGKGRGNTSKLTFLMPLSDIVLERAKQLTLEEKLDEAWKLIHQVQQVKFEFTEWLYRHFGFQTENEEDVLRFPFYRSVLDLDPTFVNRRTEGHLIEQIFNTLVLFDNNTKTIRPSLAHFWECNEEYTEWTLYLRKGVRFHHGKRMTAEDVEFTFHRILHKSSYEEIKNTLKNVEKVNAYTVKFTLNETNVLFLNYLCSEKCSILPSNLNELHGFEANPIGTGPFRIKKNNDSILYLEANDYYFEGRPHLDAIEMWIWPNFEQSKVVEMLEKKDIYFGDDQVLNVEHTKIQHIEQGASFITINSRKAGPTQDVRFRKAIHFALDREKMISELGDMRSMPACSLFPKYSDEHFKNEYQVELAREYIQKSSYKGELLELYSYEMESNIVNTNWIKRELSQIGVNVTVTILPIKELARKEIIENIDMIFTGEVLGVQPDISLIESLTYRDGYIHNHVSENQKNVVIHTIDRCKQETSFEKRMEHLMALEEQLRKTYTLIFLYHTRQTIQHSQEMSGIMLNAWGKVDYKNVWVKGHIRKTVNH